jgi:hypothetical protein
VFRRFDGVGWTDWTREPAKQPSDHRPSPDGRSGGSSDPTPGRARGLAIQRGRSEMRQFLHDVTDDELRGLPEATRYDIEPDRPERGWSTDPAAPDLGQQRFYTGTDWSDLVAFVGRTGAPRYYRSTLEESRRRNEFRREEVSHEPSLTLAPGAAVWAVLLTTVASCLLIVAPALPTGTVSDLAHSAGVVVGLGVLTALCVAAVQIARGAFLWNGGPFRYGCPTAWPWSPPPRRRPW